MTNKPLTLLVSKLGVHVDTVDCFTVADAERRFAVLWTAGTVDPGAVYAPSPDPTRWSDPVKYLGRQH